MTTRKPVTFDDNQSLHTTLKWWNYVRWFSTISLLSVGIIQLSLRQMTLPKYSFVYTLIGVIILNMVYSFWLDTITNNRFFILLHNLLDISIFSMVIFMTGGKDSPLLWLYLIPVLTSSITMGKTVGFWASVFSIVGLLVVLFMQEYHLLANLKIDTGLLIFIQRNTHTIISSVCLIFLVYFISSFLSTTLIHQNQELMRLNADYLKKNNEMVQTYSKKLKLEKRIFIDKILRTLQHELNNPLAILAVNAELMMRDQGSSYIERVDSIQNNVSRIRAIIAKIEEHYRDGEHDLIDPYKIIEYQKKYLDDNCLVEKGMMHNVT